MAKPDILDRLASLGALVDAVDATKGDTAARGLAWVTLQEAVATHTRLTATENAMEAEAAFTERRAPVLVDDRGRDIVKPAVIGVAALDT